MSLSLCLSVCRSVSLTVCHSRVCVCVCLLCVTASERHGEAVRERSGYAQRRTVRHSAAKSATQRVFILSQADVPSQHARNYLTTLAQGQEFHPQTATEQLRARKKTEKTTNHSKM